MTKQIDDFLNIPHENEIVEVDETTDIVENNSSATSLIIPDSTHEREADEIRKKALDLQDEIAEIARNVEPSRSARMFEVSGQHLKLALEASNSKEKHKLEAAKLKLEAAKLQLNDDAVSTLNSGKEIVADRNALIRELLAEKERNTVDVEPEDDITG